MNTTSIILILLIIAVLIAFTIYFIITRRKKKYPIPTKYVTNHLRKFTDNHKKGRLIKKEIVGSNKELRKITFAAEKTDEFGEKERIYPKIIIHKNYIEENDEELEILPINETDIHPTEIHSEKLREKIRSINNIETIQKGFQEAKTNLENKFIENAGSLIHETILKATLDSIKTKEKEEKEEKEKK